MSAMAPNGLDGGGDQYASEEHLQEGYRRNRDRDPADEGAEDRACSHGRRDALNALASRDGAQPPRSPSLSLRTVIVVGSAV